MTRLEEHCLKLYEEVLRTKRRNELERLKAVNRAYRALIELRRDEAWSEAACAAYRDVMAISK